MKLTRRVNFILLPVILLVFSITGGFIFQGVRDTSRDQLQELMERELDFLEQEIALELRSVRAALSQILNSAELINYINTGATEYRAYALESRLHSLLDEARRNSPGIESIQLLNLAGEPIVTAEDGDPFAAPSVPALPPGALAATLERARAGMAIGPSEYIYQLEFGSVQFAMLQPLSPRRLQNSAAAVADADTHFVVVKARIIAFQRLVQRLKHLLGSGFYVEFHEHDNPDMRVTDPANPEWDGSEADLRLLMEDPLYRVDLVVPEAMVAARLGNTRSRLVLMVLAVTVFSFFALRLLIQRQIIAPINRLVSRVRDSHHADIKLEHVQRNDEVSELNNAYVNLLEDVHHLASFDHLTGLANRRSFQLILARQLHNCSRSSEQVALLFIDLDNFKRVNDQYGHAIGDRVLQAFSEQLRESVRPEDVAASLAANSLARLAGDEFALLLNGSPGADGASVVASRVLAMFERGFEVDGVRHNIQASIGIAISPHDGSHAQTLLRNADAAMYEAKANGKNRYQFFNREIAAVLERRQKIEKVLDDTLADRSFHLVYMPVFESTNLQVVGVEVLLRSPALSEMGIGPDEFIPVAESTGRIKEIDLRVIEESLSSFRELQQKFGYRGYFAINISAVELHNDDFPGQVAQLIARYGVDPGLIELEITETSLVNDDADSIRILGELKALGVRLSLDDFGTGYTAFNQLANYPVDTLKIDRSFVNDLAGGEVHKHRMVDIILSLADLYQLRVVAEGVETPEQLKYLRERGCQQLQGYFLSTPLSWSDMQDLAAGRSGSQWESSDSATDDRRQDSPAGEHLKLLGSGR